MLNRAPNRHAPYVGESAFATKAGIHASAIMKEPATYEHVPPDAVGNRRKLSGLGSGRQIERARRARPHRAQGRQGRSPHRPAARRGEGARGDRLCLRGGGCLLRAPRAARPRQGAELFRRREVRRQCRAARQRARPARHGVVGGGQGEGRRRNADLGGGRQRARSTRSIWRCARIWASIRATSAGSS